MIKGENEDGTVFYRFEESELGAKRRLEESLLAPDLDQLMEAVAFAAARISQRKQEEWEELRKAIKEQFGDDLGHFGYAWASGKITPQKED